MVIFNSYVTNYQRVTINKWHLTSEYWILLDTGLSDK